MTTISRPVQAAETRVPRHIVVGVNGSEPSLAALSFAMDEALQSQAELQVILAWRFPEGWGAPMTEPLGQENAEMELKSATNRVSEERRLKGNEVPPFTTDVVNGTAAEVLRRAAGKASLLVVGSRDHRAPMGSLLGPVSQACAIHAPCPVVIVPGPSHRGSVGIMTIETPSSS